MSGRRLAAVALVFAGCGGPPGRVATLAKFPAGVLSLARAGDDLWVGTGDGLVRLPGGHGPAETFGDAAGLTGGLKQVRWIAVRKDELYLATSAGVARFATGARKVAASWTAKHGLGADSTRWVGESGGRIWAGTIFGASRLSADGRSWTTYKIAQGLPQDHVYRMLDDGGTLWGSSMNGGLVRFESAAGRFTVIPQAHGLGNRHIYAMAPDPAGGLWLGTAGGLNLYRKQPAGWDEKICADGFTDYTVYAVLPEGRRVWFGTAFGLSRRDLDTGRQVQWTTANGLPHNEVVAILPAPGGVDVATRFGVVHITE